MNATHFVLFLRNIGRNKAFSFINIFGLALGFTACLITYLYVSDELSYDRYHDKSHRVYRLLSHNPAHNIYAGIQPAKFYDFAKDNVPGVEKIIRLFRWEGAVSSGDKKFHEIDLRFSEQEVFDVFSWKFVSGDKETAFSNPNSIVISQTAAKKYFGDENPTGKTIRLDNALDLVISGVIEDVPKNSHFRFDFMGNAHIFNNINPSALTNWDNASVFFYFLLNENADPEEVGKVLHERYVSSIPENKKAPPAFALQNLEDIHLHSSNVRWDIGSHGNIQTVYGFSVVAFLIMLIACFNFTNLTTASATSRAKEVGLKKVLGARRKWLIIQFLAESFIFSLIAMLVSMLMIELILPVFNQMTGKELSFSFISEPHLLFIITVLLIGVSLLAGIYPAFVLSGFHPLSILKGGSVVELFRGFGKKKLQLRTRQVLIILQFAISAGLIISAFLINKQMQFIRHKDLGFNQEQILIIENPWDSLMSVRYERLRTDLMKVPSVLGISGSHNVPGRNLNNYTSGFRQRNAPREDGVHTGLVSVDFDYFDVMQASIVAGRNFSKDYATEAAQSCIVNETLARALKVDDPIGLEVEGFYDGNPRKIIGVLGDMHFNSLHENITPAAFLVSGDDYPQYYLNIIIRLSETNLPQTLQQIENAWTDIAPDWPFQSYFLDARLDELYRQDKQVTRTTNIFSFLAIFLSLMGLFGLILFVMRSRTKEIGIRQVHGATAGELVRMFSAEFAKLLIIANLLAWPAAYFIIRNWLERFVFRITIDALPFVAAAVITLLLALAMVVYHVIRTLHSHPVRALKYE